MQYNLEEFNDYLKEYLGIKERIEETKNILDKERQKEFNECNCNNSFFRYKLNKKKIEELEKALDKLYKDFIESDAFPFSKDEFHFFVSNDTYLVDAITGEDSSELNEEENIFLSNSINYRLAHDPNNYKEEDIPAIKVFYLRNKDKYDATTLKFNIIANVISSRMFDDKKNKILFEPLEFPNNTKIEKWKTDLIEQKKEIVNSNSPQKELLLFSLKTAFYELELLDGKRVTDIYNYLQKVLVMVKTKREKGEISKRVFFRIFSNVNYNIDALVSAYYNLTDQNRRENSAYYEDTSFMSVNFYTANPEINKRLLKMMKR